VPGYSTTPLSKKLGIRESALVVLFGAPAAFRSALDPLPPGARVLDDLPEKERFDVAIVFAPTQRAFEKGFLAAKKRMKHDAGIWASWPKKASKIVTDINEASVREFGLASGLVDTKVCAIDATWSGLRFVVRVSDRASF